MDVVVEYAVDELTNLMNDWCNNNETGCTGGKMREARGSGIEEYVIRVLTKLAVELQIPLVAKKGKYDKKQLRVPTSDIVKEHQVDVHVYLNNKFIMVIECKAYLDSCYYVRACDDFNLFKKFNYDVKHVIFTLENSIDPSTKKFTDFVHDNVCDNVFYMLDGKRSSNKPIYEREHKKDVNKKNVRNFIEYIKQHVCG